MSDVARRLLNPLVPGRQGGQARPYTSQSPRRLCLTALIALVVQFGLGMILNLYVSVPASDHHAGIVHEIETAPPVLIIHILLGIALICAAGVLFIRAIGDRDRVMIAMTATGLAAILGAYAAGEVFVRNGHKSESLTMAILTGIALLCYIGMLAAMSAAPGQAVRVPRRPAAASRPNPEPSGAVVPRPRPVNRLSGPQRRLGHPEPRPAHVGAAAPRSRPSYPATDAQTDPQFAQTDPRLRAARQTGPQPRATYPYPPAAPQPQQRRPQPTAGRDYPHREDPVS